MYSLTLWTTSLANKNLNLQQERKLPDKNHQNRSVIRQHIVWSTANPPSNKTSLQIQERIHSDNTIDQQQANTANTAKSRDYQST
jgi:hypothetical protein